MATEEASVVHVRHRRPEDMPQCVALLEKVFRHDSYPARWPADVEGWIANTTEQESWVVGNSHGSVVGHIDRRVATDHPVTPLWCAKSARPRGKLAVISRLFVDPSHYGKGLGSKLLATAVQRSQELGLQPVLDVLANQTRLVTFYEKRDWVVVGAADDTWMSAADPIRVIALIGPSVTTLPQGPKPR